MRNIKAWLHDYENLSFEQRAEVAKAIVKDLENSQYYFMQNDDDMTKVMAFFKRLLASSNQKNILNEYKSLLKRFEGLSQINKEKALGEIINIIKSAISEQEQEDKENVCRLHGHSFSEWKYNSWTETGIETDPRFLQEHPTGRYEIERHDWSRTCLRCGYIEEAIYEPEEVKTKRLQREKEERIKELKKELKRLEDN